MSDKSLKSKAIDIKGKQYVLVADRVTYFNDAYPNGSIETKRIASEGDVEVFQAIVTPDTAHPSRCFVAHSQARWGEGMVNKTAALENAETSAVGRALALMGIGVIESIASADEIHKATQAPSYVRKPATTQASPELKLKQEIVRLAGEIDPLVMPNNLPAFKEWILKHTQLPLVSENLQEIAERLQIIVDEIRQS